jgi:hypothetical protein
MFAGRVDPLGVTFDASRRRSTAAADQQELLEAIIKVGGEPRDPEL